MAPPQGNTQGPPNQFHHAEGYFIPNPRRRQSIGNRSNLAPNLDGSLDLYFQADSPGADEEANSFEFGSSPRGTAHWQTAKAVTPAFAEP